MGTLERVVSGEQSVSKKPDVVWTVQGDSKDVGGWLVGGVFSSLESACEFAEAWASDKPGLAVCVYQWPLDRTYGNRAQPLPTQETVFQTPPIFEEVAS